MKSSWVQLTLRSTSSAMMPHLLHSIKHLWTPKLQWGDSTQQVNWARSLFWTELIFTMIPLVIYISPQLAYSNKLQIGYSLLFYRKYKLVVLYSCTKEQMQNTRVSCFLYTCWKPEFIDEIRNVAVKVPINCTFPCRLPMSYVLQPSD